MTSGLTETHTHTVPDNGAVHTVEGHTCCFIYFWCFDPLILSPCLKPKGFECQVLAQDPHCVFCHVSAFRSLLGTAAFLLCLLPPLVQGHKPRHRFAHLFPALAVGGWHPEIWINKHVNVLQVNLRKRRTSLTLPRTGTQPCGCGAFQVCSHTNGVL